MATFIKSETGNVTNDSEFKYNTVYENNKPKEDLDPTGNGDRGFIYGEYVATKYRSNKIEEHGIGNLVGNEKDTRSGTPLGAVTNEGSFSYNAGNTDNVPNYITDENSEEEINRSNAAYTVNGNTVLELRNSNDKENGDGVFDEKINR